MPVPESIFTQVKKCVTFIFLQNEKGDLIANGTGFFLGVRNGKDKDLFNVYLVTAKHVLQAKGKFHPLIFIRLNTKAGGSEIIPIKLDENVPLYVHPETEVDIAVFGCLPDQQKYDFMFLTDDLIATKAIMQQQDICEGDDVFFSGLFTSHIGQKRNQPIVRFGKVALMSDEKIEWKEKGQPSKFMDLYLLECQSFGGNSGSPVFFNLSPFRKPGTMQIGGKNMYLAGLMTGSFLNGNEIQVPTAQNAAFSLENIGIAAVTPSYKLHEILFCDELIKSRNT